MSQPRATEPAGEPLIDHKHVKVSSRLVALNGASTVGARILNVTVLVWTFQYLLGKLPPEDFAVYPVVMALAVVPPFFFSFFTGGINRHTVEAYAKGDFEGVTRITSAIFPLLMAGAAVFVALGLTFAANVERVLNVAPDMVASAQIMTALLVISFAVQLVAMPFVAGYHIRQRYLEFSLLEFARAALRLGLVLLLILGVGPSVVFIIVATVVADLTFTIVTTLRSLGFVPELRVSLRLFSSRTAKGLVSFGLWTTVGRLAMILYTTAGTVVLNEFGRPVDVVNYYLGVTLFQQLQGLIGAAQQPLQPALIAMHALDDRERLARAVATAGRYALWVSLFPALALAFFADEILMHLFDPKYASAGLVIILFMATFPFTQPTGSLAMLAIARGKIRAFNCAALACTATGVVAMLALAEFGTVTAAGVTLILATITIVPQVLYFWGLQRQLAGLKVERFVRETLVLGMAPAAVAALAFAALRLGADTSGLTTLVASLILGGAFYGFALLLASYATREPGILENAAHKAIGFVAARAGLHRLHNLQRHFH